MKECYNIEKHTCDGRCQGASNCIVARWKRKPSRNEMIKYMEKVDDDKKAWDEIMDELKNDVEFQNEVKKLINNFTINKIK